MLDAAGYSLCSRSETKKDVSGVCSLYVVRVNITEPFISLVEVSGVADDSTEEWPGEFESFLRVSAIGDGVVEHRVASGRLRMGDRPQTREISFRSSFGSESSQNETTTHLAPDSDVGVRASKLLDMILHPLQGKFCNKKKGGFNNDISTSATGRASSRN